MKVLIVGNYGLVVENLIARLYREKCDVYLLTGSKKEEKRKGLPKHITFRFEEGSSNVKYVVQGIMPDYVVFTGAWDENYDWKREESSSAFNGALVNVLSWAKDYQVPNVCYLSCMDAKEPYDLRSRSIRNGEDICKTYADNGFCVTSLRLPYVYGAPISSCETLDMLTEQCYQIRGGNGYYSPKTSFQPIYASDMADAVYRVGMSEKKDVPYSCYEVAGKEMLDGESFKDCVEDLYANLAPTAKGSILITDTELPEGKAFEEEFGYYPKIDVKTGLSRIDAFLVKKRKKIEAKRRELEDEARREQQEHVRRQMQLAMSKIRNIAENIILFLIALGAEVFLKDEVAAFAKVDFFLFYIVLIAIRRGVGESILAVLLATGANLWMEMLQGVGFNNALTQYDFIIQFLFYFIIALSISYSFMRNRINLKEQMEQLKDLEEEYQRIIDVNKTNVEIKQAFEDRLINYDDSIGKIYNVVSQLDVLEVDKIMSSALKVVSQIMRVRDVSIYYAGTNGYFHFVGSTTKEVREQRAILLCDYKEMESVLNEGEVFINREVGSNLPRMAAPIFSGNKLIYIIMLWNMDFEELNLYKKNLFLVLVRIITSSLEKGYQYEKVGRSQEYYEDMDIMLPESFMNKVKEQLENVSVEDADYALIQIEQGTRSMSQMNAELIRLLRDSDRIGCLKENDSYLYILAHTNYKDAEFVVRKLQREGFTSKVVMLDEI